MLNKLGKRRANTLEPGSPFPNLIHHSICGEKNAMEPDRERNKMGKIHQHALLGQDLTLILIHRIGYEDHIEVVIFNSADVGPCPQIATFQQPLEQLENRPPAPCSWPDNTEGQLEVPIWKGVHKLPRNHIYFRL